MAPITAPPAPAHLDHEWRVPARAWSASAPAVSKDTGPAPGPVPLRSFFNRPLMTCRLPPRLG